MRMGRRTFINEKVKAWVLEVGISSATGRIFPSLFELGFKIHLKRFIKCHEFVQGITSSRPIGMCCEKSTVLLYMLNMLLSNVILSEPLNKYLYTVSSSPERKVNVHLRHCTPHIPRDARIGARCNHSVPCTCS